MRSVKSGRIIIVDEKRFTRFSLFFLACLWLVALLIMLTVNTVYAERVSGDVPQNPPRQFSIKELNYINSFNKVEIVISKGDTAWDIQERLTPKEDVRKALYHVAKLNNRTMIGELFEGEKITFLKAK